MQGMAVAYINDTFSVETDELNVEQMTFGDFVRALETAEKNGTREELERRLAEQLMPMIETVMAQAQMPPEGGATQPIA